MRPFGIKAYTLNYKFLKLNTNKLSSRAYISYLIRYNLTNIQRIQVPKLKRSIIRTRDVIFIDSKEAYYKEEATKKQEITKLEDLVRLIKILPTEAINKAELKLKAYTKPLLLNGNRYLY